MRVPSPVPPNRPRRTPRTAASPPDSGARARSRAWHLPAILVGAALLRLAHMGGPIDEPNAWRQADTAQYARAFFEDGIDLLRPSVCWLGPHRTLALEFPLPEAITALGYGAIGRESLP